MMDDNQIKCFIHVASGKSFTRAAEALNLSQPTVSRYIRKLEEELQCELLSRSTKRVELTEAGKYYYHLFLSWQMDLEIAHKYVDKIAATSSVVLKLGYPEDWDLTSSFQQICERLNYDRTKIRLDLFCFEHRELYDKLLAKSIDLVMMINNPMLTNERLDRKKLTSIRKVLVYSDRHPQAKQNIPSVEDFAHAIFYLPEESVNANLKL